MPNINDLFTILALVIGCIITIFVAVLEIFILIFIWDGTWNVNTRKGKRRGINLEKLISESSGDASLARFQLLIFVFVISMSLVLIITSGKPPSFPASIPDQILGLLGISSTSYVLGKALQGIKPSSAEEPSSVATAASPPPSPEPQSYDGQDLPPS
ncbi:hypothetical protein [Calothrix sp. PCC 7507]|uniref:hypothetical protein n=1 Tax=Calothrix sp. PCC 7507 TaxID=99598 RepID=UPI00029EEE5D|nr:hypothetical protein [Calothrix sp. PCC 7507]AFY35465.1 hypothetical protein Cal7507_5123 [Calothrix sp. PCC 7507]